MKPLNRESRIWHDMAVRRNQVYTIQRKMYIQAREHGYG